MGLFDKRTPEQKAADKAESEKNWAEYKEKERIESHPTTGQQDREWEDDGFEYNKQAIKNMWSDNEKLRQELSTLREKTGKLIEYLNMRLLVHGYINPEDLKLELQSLQQSGEVK